MERNENIDWLKGVCILFVVVTHHAWGENKRSMFGFPFWIDMAVPLFMLISGYVYFNSYKRKDIETLDQAYTFQNLLPSFVRYTVPFLLAYMLEVMVLVTYMFMGKGEITIGALVIGCLTGGYGPGSYYYPVMLQLLLSFPFIYRFVNRYRGKSVIFFLGLNIFWEILKIAYGVPEGLYRLLFFRYIFLVSFGAYCAMVNIRINVKYCFAGMIGILFLISTSYLGYEARIFEYWTGTCVLAVLYVIPLFVLFINCREFKFGRLLKLMGRCSYHIFLTQMVYYNFLAGNIYKYIADRELVLMINILITVGLGIVFYMLEHPVTERIKRFILQEVKVQSLFAS